MILRSLQAQEHGEVPRARPLHTPYGLVTGNSLGSALHLERDGPRLLVRGPGAGAYIALSPEGRRIGFKQIGPRVGQAPAEVDLATGTVRQLWPSSPRVGQVSYARDGITAFTVDTMLVLLGRDSVRYIDLGTYANLCPVSPDGRWAVYNGPDDQLWLLSIEAGDRRQITDGRVGYMHPQWSGDAGAILFSSLHGQMLVYELESKTTTTLGEGWAAAWSPDSRRIAFYRKEIRAGRLVNSDLFLVFRDGTGMRALTETPSKCEMDPSFLTSGSGLVFAVAGERSVRSLDLDGWGKVAGAEPTLLVDYAGHESPFAPAEPPVMDASLEMDIPYVHQVYDTPDWFNGHWACAPTQAIMVLAHYGILPPWETVCSWPTRHRNSWGAYVAEPYQFRQTAYTFTADDPSGTPGRGGYGFMWTGSWSPHSRMADYYRRHGMSAVQTEGTSYTSAFAEVAAGYPLSMCVMLTSAGHLVLAHGIGSEPHTFIFNDPYGDKNTGYWNYQGKDVRYDWPGYNNGFQNLNGVAWCIATRVTELAPADTVVDDLDFSGGFTMQTSDPASMSLWKDLNRGYAGHLWFATTRANPEGDVCSAEWRPSLPVGGTYEVSAYVALSNATAAVYHVRHAGGETAVLLNQSAFTESWAPIGTFTFSAGQEGSVRLGDASDSVGQEIVFDAIRWTLAGDPTTEVAADARPADNFRLLQNYPNPFNPRTTIRYVLARRSFVTLEVFDALGARVASLVRGERGEGLHSVTWEAADLPSGVYICRLQATSPAGPSLGLDSRKLLLLR